MRRHAALLGLIICAWFAGCDSFQTQPRSEFFSTRGGPNRDVFEEGGELVPPAKPGKQKADQSEPQDSAPSSGK